MRTHIHLSTRVVQFLMLGLIGLLGAGCNSYQPVADNDGIYQSETRAVEVETEEDKNNYYKQYFSTKAAQMEEIPEEDVIFTDIEAYTTTESIDDRGYVVVEDNYNESYGGWGMNGGEVSVNIYNTGWYGGWYGGWYSPWGFGAWGYPYYGWGGYWGNPYWGWGGYWGYPYYGWGGYWGNPYCNPYSYPYGGHYGYASLNRGSSNLDYLNLSYNNIL